MRTKKILITPHGRETIVLSSKDVPNGKLVIRMSSVYHDFIVAELSVRFCKSRYKDDLSDELVDEALYRTHITPAISPYDSTI